MSKPVGRNNAKIITRNQGGGNKLQGLAPGCTAFYIAQSTGQSYYTETGDGRNRNLVICVNQLGGIGRKRSQFRPNADGNRGTGCNVNDDPLLTFLAVKTPSSNSGNKVMMAIFVEHSNQIVTDFSGINEGISAERFNLYFADINLKPKSTTKVTYKYPALDADYDYIGMNLGAFIISSKDNFDDDYSVSAFISETSTRLLDLNNRVIKRLNKDNFTISFKLISGYSFTIIDKNTQKILTFNSLNNKYYNIIHTFLSNIEYS